MKHTMKKTVIGIFFLVFLMSMKAEERIIFSENFEESTVGTDLVGKMQVKNFNSEGGANWTYDLATGAQALSGAKSAHLNILNAGNQWWGLQFKVEDAASTTVGKSLKYKTTFKIKSSTADNFFQFYIQGMSGFVQEVPIPAGNVIQEITIESIPMDNTGMANFMWAFGSHANVGDIWIDDIVISEIYEPINYSENFNNVVPTATTIGDITLANYGNGAWTFGVEPLESDASNQCAWMNITENSTDWWTLQFKIDKFAAIKDKQYIISFKAKSTVPNSFSVRVEGVSSYVANINTTGGDTFESFVLETSPMDKSGLANFLWGFGRPTVYDKICIDDLMIQEKSVTTKIPDFPEGSDVKLYFSENQLRIVNGLYSNVYVYSPAGVLLACSQTDNHDDSVSIPGGQKLLIVKIIDAGGRITTKKVIAQN
ncbi:MAG: hypothetical protein BGP01_06325 [Paludibacter sp. 47-17]|nr:MAG: hypothetical protein BGP01_06325 [Paludibacter sp. 47-17]